jgi:PelA/Pel-15E family pectate lyase
MRVAGFLALLLLLRAATLPAQAREAMLRIDPVEPGPLLAPARIARLAPGPRAAWERYLAESREWARRDAEVMQAELRAAGRERLTPAPEGPGSTVDGERPAGFYRTPAARDTADVVLSYQTPSGGWSKRVDWSRGPRRPGQSYSVDDGWSYVATLDNGATTGQMEILAGTHEATGEPRYRDGFLRGLRYLLRAQYPTGCWPQVYPLQGSYHDAATLNDDAMVHALRLLQDVARGRHAFVPDSLRRRADLAVQRGVECLLASQVVVDGKRTVWGAQSDPLTLVPVKARAYEHPSLSGGESAAVMDFLMDLEHPDPRVPAALRDAAAWFRRTAIWGYDYGYKKDLVKRPGAGPIWARFYEIGTDRPIFSGRDGVIRYDLHDIEPERRYGYAWYRSEAAEVLRRYEEWVR